MKVLHTSLEDTLYNRKYRITVEYMYTYKNVIQHYRIIRFTYPTQLSSMQHRFEEIKYAKQEITLFKISDMKCKSNNTI